MNEEWLNTNYGSIYEDGYTPGDPLGEPGDYEKRIMDELRQFEKEAWIRSIGQENYNKLVKEIDKMNAGKEKIFMTNKELTQIRESLSLTKKEFAEKIGATAMMVGRYEKGTLTIPDAVAERVKALVEPVAPTEEDITALVKLARESLNVSKSAFAKLIGVSATMAGNYESGKSKPKDEILEKIKGLIKEEAVPAAPVDEEKEEAAPVYEKKEEAPVAAEEEAEEPVPAKKKSAPAKKKEKSASGDEKKPVEEDKKTSIVIESKMGGTISTDEIISRIPDGCNTVYVKPEENAAYWVRGEESGVVNLW